MVRGNGGRKIFFSDADRSRFCLLLQEGIERYNCRIHAFCQMTNHVHLVIQVGDIPLSRIMQNVSFRYTRYINSARNETGHLFQGRYKALLIDGDSYLVELVRYIHCNPVRAGLVANPNEYQWSSHNAYLGRNPIAWLTIDLVLSQFAGRKNRAGKLYGDFVQAGITEPHRDEFHSGTCEGRILGDENFSVKARALAEEKLKNRWTLKQILDLLLTDLGNTLKRDSSALSRVASRIREREKSNSNLADKVASTRRYLMLV